MKNIATDKQLDMFRGTEEIMNAARYNEFRTEATVKSPEITFASNAVTSDLKKFEDCSETMQNLKNTATFYVKE